MPAPTSKPSDLFAVAQRHVPEIGDDPVGGGGEAVPRRRNVFQQREPALAFPRLVAAGADDAPPVEQAAGQTAVGGRPQEHAEAGVLRRRVLIEHAGLRDVRVGDPVGGGEGGADEDRSIVLIAQEPDGAAQIEPGRRSATE